MREPGGAFRGTGMARKQHKPEIVTRLRRVAVLVGQGKTVAEGARAIGVEKAPHDRWRAKHGDLELDQMRRLKQLEQENSRPWRAVSDLMLEKPILKEAASGDF